MVKKTTLKEHWDTIIRALEGSQSRGVFNLLDSKMVYEAIQAIGLSVDPLIKAEQDQIASDPEQNN